MMKVLRVSRAIAQGVILILLCLGRETASQNDDLGKRALVQIANAGQHS